MRALGSGLLPAPPVVAPDHQNLRQDALFRVQQAGVLVRCPNDAVGPPGAATRFYRNNAGQIWVTLQRCDGPCACPVAAPG